VTASLAGRIRERVADAAPGGAPLRIVLRRGAAVEARLVDASGAPLAGVVVELEHPTDPEMRVTLRTSPDGRFGFDRLPPSTYRVWVYRGERERVDAGSVTAGSGEVADITVR